MKRYPFITKWQGLLLRKLQNCIKMSKRTKNHANYQFPAFFKA